MAYPTVYPSRRPPGLYRLARLFRRLSVVVLLLLVIYLATVGYSAYELVQSSPESGGYSAAFAANDTLAVTGSLTVSNPGFYALTGFALELRIQNGSGVLLGDLHQGPETLAAQGKTTFPIALYLPIGPNTAAASLLVTDQYLTVGAWGNATYAYLFPVSVHFDQNRSWGAPFANLQITAGTPTLVGGSLEVPITVSFSNHASFAEVGTLALTVRASNGTDCGGTSFPLNVPPQMFYYQTENVVFANGCSTSGDTVDSTFTGPGVSIVLPPESFA